MLSCFLASVLYLLQQLRCDFQVIGNLGLDGILVVLRHHVARS